MNYLSEMEFGTKWDWENLVPFGSKAIECPKKLQLADWMIVDDGEINGGSLNLWGEASGSDEWHGSSAKSSISALTDSSPKDVNQTPNFRFITFEGSSENFGDKLGMKGTELYETSSPHLEASVGSMEQLIGLKLGKRTYFENSTSLSVLPTPITTIQKKMKLSSQKAAIIPRCQVDGCNMDLSLAKDYHRKHRVCGSHSKSQKVIIGGHERRFCQQCSRFQYLGEFDERKRSCRRRLSDHNARRRKPQHETIQFSSAKLLPPFNGTWGRQQTNFLLNNAPLVHPTIYSKWNATCNSSKFTLTKGGYPLKSYGDGFTVERLRHMPGGVGKLSQVANMNGNAVNGLLASKSPKLEVLSPGLKGSMISPSHVDAAPVSSYSSRALSLLSNNSCWGGSYGPDSIPVVHHPIPMLENYTSSSSITQPPIMTNAIPIPEAVPLSYPSEYFWLPTGQHETHHHVQSVATTNSTSKFEEFRVFKTPYPYEEEADLYSNMC